MQIDVTSQFADLLPLNVDTFKKMPLLRFLKFNFPLHAEISLPQSHVEALLQVTKGDVIFGWLNAYFVPNFVLWCFKFIDIYILAS